ncbi:MAG: hypothetical protein ACRC33_15805 [Gemmataceae bacterium]
MGGRNGKVVPVDIVLFGKNRRRVDPASLTVYANKRIAWNGDGTCILASGTDYEDVIEELKRLGIPTDRVVFDWVPDPEVSQL